MKFQSVNPATEAVIATFEGTTFEEAAKMSEMCKTVQKEWHAEGIEKRSALIKNCASVLRAGALDYAKLMTMEMGKPIVQSKAEVEKCAWLCEYYAENAAALLQKEIIKTEAKKSFVCFDPLGVVLAIMPWNFPFWQVFRCAVPILVTGNGLVLKHASNVPKCALALEEIFLKAGFPKGLFKTLLINSETAEKLIAIDAIAALSLTGSTEAGSAVASIAGKHIKKCVLELGGSDPFIVLADADLDLAAKTAVQARLINAGQSCIAAKRFIVEKSVAAKFTEKVEVFFKTQKMGDPLDQTVTVGPLAKEELVLTLEKQVQDAVSKGVRVLSGGKRGSFKGYFFEPTLLTEVTKNMAVYREEVFGPVMCILISENADDAIRIANESEYGLGASIWTADRARAERLAGEIESGFVSINGMVKSDPRLPFGGVKKSGFGRELGIYGLKEFVNVKTVVVN